MIIQFYIVLHKLTVTCSLLKNLTSFWGTQIHVLKSYPIVQECQDCALLVITTLPDWN